MNKKISKVCLIVGILLLAICGIAAFLGMSYDLYLMAVILLMIESVVSRFSERHLALNIIVALVAVAEIIASIVTGMIPFAVVGILMIAVCVIMERTLLRA